MRDDKGRYRKIPDLSDPTAHLISKAAEVGLDKASTFFITKHPRIEID
jgi:hypothetical protein